MILLDSPLEFGPVSLYRDHLAPSTFHYLPGRPRLVEATGFGLLIYRGAATDLVRGGLLTLDVDLAHRPEDLAAAAAGLERRFGVPPDLIPVLFDTGTVRLTTLGTATPTEPSETVEGPPHQQLVEQLIGTATPSLLGHQRATFSIRLAAEGAIALREAILAGTLPAVVAFDLAFRGVRPANGLRAALDYAMAYDYLRTQAAGGTLWFRADLDHEAETLERDGHLTITDVDYTGSDPEVLTARREAARVMLHELVETAFFRPAASPAILGATARADVDAAWAAGGRATVAFVLRGLDQDEEQHATYDRSEMSVATVRVGPQGLITVPAGVDRAGLVREVDLDADPGPTKISVTAVEGADWTGVDALRVDLSSSDQVRTVVLTAVAPAAAVVAPAGPTPVSVTVFATPAPGDLGAAPAVGPVIVPLAGGSLVLDPAALAGRSVLTVALGAIPTELVSAATVRITAGSRSTEQTLHAEQPAVAVPIWGDPPVTVAVTLTTTVGPVSWTQAVPHGQLVVLVNRPRDRFRTVTAIASDPLGRYQSIDVELEAHAGAPRERLTLDAATPSAYWTRAVEPDDPGSYRVRVTRLGRDGVVSAGDWVEAADSLLVVGDRDLRVDEITVVLTGWTDIVGALLSLTSGSPPDGVGGSVEVLVSDPTVPVTVSLPSRSTAPLVYNVTGQIFRTDEVLPISLTGQSDEVLILTPQ